MTTVATSYWPADTSEPVLETTVGGILRAAADAGPDLTAMVAGVPTRPSAGAGPTPSSWPRPSRRRAR